MKKTIFLLLCSLLSLVAYGQDYPTRTIGSKSYYVYTVEAGDGLFAIGRKFNVTQAELHEANPGLVPEIQVGQEILVPAMNSGRTASMATADTTNTNGHIIRHTVLPQQTLYAISKIYGVSIEQIKAHNPGCENGIKVGDVLKIPVAGKGNAQSAAPKSVTVKSTREHVVKHKETLYSICRQYNVDMNEVLALNPGLTEHVKEGQRILIPVSETRTTSQQKGNSSSKTSEPVKGNNVSESTTAKLASVTSQGSNSKSSANFTEELPSWSNRTISGNRLKVALLLPLMTETVDVDGVAERFVSFYRGALLAMDELKSCGVTLDVYTYDIGKDTSLLLSALNEPAMKTMDLIIGPAYKAQVPYVSQFAKQHQIYTVIPFTSQINNWDLNEYVFQFNPSFRELYSIVAERIVKNCDKAPFVIIKFPYSNNRGNNLAVELVRSLQKRKISYREIAITNYESDSIATLIGRNKCNIFIASNETRDAKFVLDQLVDNNLTYQTIWGFEEWSSLLGRMQDAYYFTLFAPRATVTYNAKYAEWFGSRPSAAETPNYDLLGYDIMMYFGHAARHTSNGVSIQEPNVQSKMLQSSFAFMRERYGKHYVNINNYLIHWNGQAFSSPVRYK